MRSLIHFLIFFIFVRRFFIREKVLPGRLLLANPVTFLNRYIQRVISIKLLNGIFDRNLRLLCRYSVICDVMQLVLVEFRCHGDRSHRVPCGWNLLALLNTPLAWNARLNCLVELFDVNVFIKIDPFNYGLIRGELILTQLILDIIRIMLLVILMWRQIEGWLSQLFFFMFLDLFVLLLFWFILTIFQLILVFGLLLKFYLLQRLWIDEVFVQ